MPARGHKAAAKRPVGPIALSTYGSKERLSSCPASSVAAANALHPSFLPGSPAALGWLQAIRTSPAMLSVPYSTWGSFAIVNNTEVFQCVFFSAVRIIFLRKEAIVLGSSRQS